MGLPKHDSVTLDILEDKGNVVNSKNTEAVLLGNPKVLSTA